MQLYELLSPYLRLSSFLYLDDLLNIDNFYFKKLINQIYTTKLQLNKVNSFDTEAAFLDLDLSLTNDLVLSKIYNKQNNFNLEIVNSPF